MECGVRSEECGVCRCRVWWSVECGVSSVVCGVRRVECKVWSVECAVGKVWSVQWVKCGA